MRFVMIRSDGTSVPAGNIKSITPYYGLNGVEKEVSTVTMYDGSTYDRCYACDHLVREINILENM